MDSVIKKVLFLGLIFFSSTVVFGGVQSAVGGLKVVNVRSQKQSYLNSSKIVFEDDVEILLDGKVHIWADVVELDKDQETVHARAKKSSFVMLENDDFVMLADYVFLDIKHKTGYADNIKIHVQEGFIAAAHAQKVDDRTWKMEDLTYTSCDKSPAHWQFTAQKAKLYKNSVLRASGLLFKLSDIPFFAFPALVFPLQNRAGSGFLIPRLYFDADHGLGFKQEYYWFITPQVDTTAGISILRDKGLLLVDEFRWVHNQENFLVMTSGYAEEWNTLLERRGKIISTTGKNYWVQGVYFQPYTLSELKIQSLLRFDFGTDKRIGYHFFDTAEQVEDSFYNSLIQRYSGPHQNVQLLAHFERCLRRQYSDYYDASAIKPSYGSLLDTPQPVVVEKKEREEDVKAYYFPHIEWNSGNHQLLPFLVYRHDFLLDYAFLDRHYTEKLYANSRLVEILCSEKPTNCETSRLFYKGGLQASCSVFDQKIRAFFEPCFQLRSNIAKQYTVNECHHQDHYAIIPRIGVEWALPENIWHASDYSLGWFLQPLVRWSLIPNVYQEHFYHIDVFDRVYPENTVEGELRSNWKMDDFGIDLICRQGYDFMPRDDIFPLRRCYNQNHLAPLYVELGCSISDLNVTVAQEYSWRNGALLQSEVTALWACHEWDFMVGYVHQNEQSQIERLLLSDIPSFAHIGFSMPLNKNVLFHYEGNFYSKYDHAFPLWNGMTPMLHHLGLDYHGHCWGCSLGFEERRYRECGLWKSEHVVTFALRLESIGSFAQKFKRPVTYHAPSDYEV